MLLLTSHIILMTPKSHKFFDDDHNYVLTTNYW